MKKMKEYESIPYQCLPLTAWQYFGYQLLFAIPVFGTFALIAVALTASNLNLRSFARSYFCGFIIALALIVVILVFVVVIGGAVGLDIQTLISYLKDYIEQFTTTA